MSLPHIWWMDNKNWMELLYRANQIHLNQLHLMFAASATSIVNLWEKQVLRGIKMCISYDTLADALGNGDFLTDPIIMGQFGVLRDGRMIWDMGALQEWLDDYAEFQVQILLHCETLSGAPGHGMELTLLTICNTREHSQRSLVILGKHVTLLHCYYKSAAITGHKKLIPHALNALTADLLIQSLALAQPFAELAAHICYPDQPEVLKLYKTLLFINNSHLFTTKNISHSMAKLSVEHLSLKLTVNPWQHISISFKCKLGQFAEELIDMDENDT
ncbi:hypothetical protein BKA83DRAFT_4495273 [Pisolithus microcarpus]|nr:hypothetical protein BKA83DRAFT_4495273 [Pisolithus microcarpus]